MPTIISHSIVGLGLASFFPIARKKVFIVTVIILSSLPDFDTILMGIFGRDSIFRHRGFMHSIIFAIVVSLLVTLCFRRKQWIAAAESVKAFLLFFIAIMAHPVLDGLSTGFRYGVAYFAPFDMTRYLFPVSPLPLAPLSPMQLLSEQGAVLFLTEALLLWTLSTGLILWNSNSKKPIHKYSSVLLFMVGVAAWIIRLSATD